MWKFTSEARLRRALTAALALLALTAVVFYALQNHVRIPGGAIAPAKMIWLTYTVLFWLILPAFIGADPRTPPRLRVVFLFLFWMMAVRGYAELWMIYVFFNWHTLGGAAHDFVCAVGMLVLGVWACHAGEHRRTALGGWLTLHAGLTGAMLLCEICFARYLWSHYVTLGEQPVYFVPDEAQHRGVLAVTAAVNTVLTGHLFFLLRHWIYVKDDRAPA